MRSTDILVTTSDKSHTVSLNQLLSSPGQELIKESKFVWLLADEQRQKLEDCEEQLPAGEDIVQFSSFRCLSDLLEVAPLTLRASLGITGVTAVRSEILRELLPSDTEYGSEVDFLLALVEATSAWSVVNAPDVRFTRQSPIPVSSQAYDQSLLGTLEELNDDELLTDDSAALAGSEIRSGLLLIHDFLEPSHELSQSIQGSGSDVNGDYWHGLMHRREPDFGNAKYWFRRVGNHPCFPKLCETAIELAQTYGDDELQREIAPMTRSGWDSLAAVDFYQKAHRPDQNSSLLHEYAETLQLLEMWILLEHCCEPMV